MTYLVTLNTLLVLAVMWHTKARADDIQDFFRIHLHDLERDIMSTQETINAVVAQLNKVRLEVTDARDALMAKIADLNVQIADAGVAEVVDTSELTAAAQALDDIVPDAVPDVVPDVAPEAPVE
jgi:seryl-tRNA synthetase